VERNLRRARAPAASLRLAYDAPSPHDESDVTEEFDMRNELVLSAFGLCLLACSHEKPAENANANTTTTTSTDMTPATPEEVRAVLIERRPNAAGEINALVITNEGGLITLRGKVDDESTHSDLVNRVKQMRNVRGVKDELQVEPKVGHDTSGQYGTTTTTGATEGGEHRAKSEDVRKHLEKAQPRSLTIIKGLMITEDGDVVTIAGIVPDEATHQALAKAARETPNVKGVKDEMKVQKK
jgi:osmotically-inducible protein OsmY